MKAALIFLSYLLPAVFATVWLIGWVALELHTFLKS
jgi:hypothetical protein